MERAGFNTKGSLAFLLVLSGGGILGALTGSRFADRFGPKPVVISCFLIGAVSIALLTLDLPLGKHSAADSDQRMTLSPVGRLGFRWWLVATSCQAGAGSAGIQGRPVSASRSAVILSRPCLAAVER